MSEILRALIVILIVATAFFTFAKETACQISDPKDIERRRNFWFIFTIVAFVAQNFWIYTLVVALLLIYANRRESNPPALYFFLLLLLPVGQISIPGMGVINYLFDLSNVRLMALLILVPAFFSLRRQIDAVPFGRTGADKAIAAYLILLVILNMREPNLTNNLRQDFGIFIDIFLPYYVISRSLATMQSFRDALLSLELAIMVIAALAIVEFSKKWVLYSALGSAMNLTPGLDYLGRDGLLRAVVTTGQAISMGYLMVIGLGIYLFLQRFIISKLIRRVGYVLLAGGLIAPLSRGPWLGFVFLLVVFIVTGPKFARNLAVLSLTAILAFSVVSVLPGGERVINLLPIIGTTESENVTYRERLFTNASIVIERNLWFGSLDYITTPEMEAMRQGQGIIDIVNTYLQVLLDTGVVGLGLFVGFFALIVSGIYRAMSSIQDKSSDAYLLGRALLSTQLAILFMIFTVSNNYVIAVMYWPLAGLGMGYALMARKIKDRVDKL